MNSYLYYCSVTTLCLTSPDIPLVVLQITPSSSINNEGKTRITVSILIIAPLAIKLHITLMIPTLEYIATPIVAVKNPSALTIIEGIEAAAASIIAVRFSSPLSL